MEINKKLALNQLEVWDCLEEERVLTKEESEAKKEAKDMYKKWVLLEEMHWRQKSIEIWLREGDRNTGFFHCMTNSHFRKNAIIRIKVNVVWLPEKQEIREGVAGAFQCLFSDNMVGRADIASLPFVSLTLEEARSLEVSFKEEEIFTALNELNGEKAWGLDGVSLAFWQSSWLFVKEDIMGVFKEFYEKGTFTKSINTTFLVLIPKKGGAEDLKDFQPISLVGNLYKLLANCWQIGCGGSCL